MKLMVLRILGLIVQAASIRIAFAAFRNEYSNNQAHRSEIGEQVRSNMEEFQNEDWWNDMEEHTE